MGGVMDNEFMPEFLVTCWGD